MSLRHTLPPPVLFSAIDCKIGDVFLLTGANWVRVQLIECSYNDSIFLYLKQAAALERALVCVEGIEEETPQHLCRHRVHSSLVLACKAKLFSMKKSIKKRNNDRLAAPAFLLSFLHQ